MIVFSAQVFDDVISGTAATWYSAAQFNRGIGAADGYAVQACTTDVSGTTNLTVRAEHSVDDQNWVEVPASGIDANSVSNGGSYVGQASLGAHALLSHVRFKITLGGTNPQCRVKLYVTGRLSGGSGGQS